MKCPGCSLIALALTTAPSAAADLINITDFAPPGASLDRTGKTDVSDALIHAIEKANTFTGHGEPTCVYIPAGIYRIRRNPPQFARAGCIKGDGASLSILLLDKVFSGDLFTWSEAWVLTTPGPRVVGLTIKGDGRSDNVQNALVFYDRNDQVFLDDLEINNLNGRALYSGMTKHTTQAYMRESHLRSLRFFDDGAANTPVVEFSSQGGDKTDATNEITLDQVDIFGAHGPSLVIRNGGEGGVRNLKIIALRVEGKENAHYPVDLVTIGDPKMNGSVNNIQFIAAELIDPYPNFAALRLTAPSPQKAPYQITFQGGIGGGAPNGMGLRIDAGRTSNFLFTGIHTFGPNVSIGPNINGIRIDGAGQESFWTFDVSKGSQISVGHK